MPRLQDIDEGIYTCPKCKQTVRRTREDFETPTLRAMFAGRLPAYLLCGKCYSGHQGQAAQHMWRADVKPSDRKPDLWGRYGSSTRKDSKATQGAFSVIKDVSFARCYRYVYHKITQGVITDTGALLNLAEDAVADVKLAKGKLNAVAVHFATSTAKAVDGQFYAIIDWAPNGLWADADTVKPGYYKPHRYTIIRQHQTKKGG